MYIYIWWKIFWYDATKRFTLLFNSYIAATWSSGLFTLPAAMRAGRILFDIQSAGCADRDSGNEITKIQWKLNRSDARCNPK